MVVGNNGQVTVQELHESTKMEMQRFNLKIDEQALPHEVQEIANALLNLRKREILNFGGMTALALQSKLFNGIPEPVDLSTKCDFEEVKESLSQELGDNFKYCSVNLGS